MIEPPRPWKTRGSFSQRQLRIFVRADFRDDEVVRLSNGSGGKTLSEYLQRGRGSRFRSRLYNLFWLIPGLFTCAISVVFAMYAEEAPMIARIGAALFSVLMLVFTLRQLAGWRCMRRHRNAPLTPKPTYGWRHHASPPGHPGPADHRHG